MHAFVSFFGDQIDVRRNLFYMFNPWVTGETHEMALPPIVAELALEAGMDRIICARGHQRDRPNTKGKHSIDELCYLHASNWISHMTEGNVVSPGETYCTYKYRQNEVTPPPLTAQPGATYSQKPCTQRHWACFRD